MYATTTEQCHLLQMLQLVRKKIKTRNDCMFYYKKNCLFKRKQYYYDLILIIDLNEAPLWKKVLIPNCTKQVERVKKYFELYSCLRKIKILLVL